MKMELGYILREWHTKNRISHQVGHPWYIYIYIYTLCITNYNQLQLVFKLPWRAPPIIIIIINICMHHSIIARVGSRTTSLKSLNPQSHLLANSQSVPIISSSSSSRWSRVTAPHLIHIVNNQTHWFLLVFLLVIEVESFGFLLFF